MSYYYSLTPYQIQERKNTFNNVFYYEDGAYILQAEMPGREELNLIADYIGYLIYRSNCKQRKYREKEINVIEYLMYFRKADKALEGVIKIIYLDEIKTINPLAYRMMERFLKMEDGI